MLNRPQARWAQFLTRFDLKITYRPEKQQGKADALSRRSYLAPRPGEQATWHDCCRDLESKREIERRLEMEMSLYYKRKCLQRVG